MLFIGVLAAMSYLAGIDAADFRSTIAGIHGATRMSDSFKSSERFVSSSEQGVSIQDSCNIFQKSSPPLEFAHGTTTLSFAFQGGIVAAVDSRASLGSFVGSKTTQKVLPINSHVLGTMAGGAADCTHWIRKLMCEAALHELTEGRRMSVAQASRLLSNALYELRGLGLSMGTMIMGFDDCEGLDAKTPPKIYYVDNSGMRIEGDVFSVGSGSTLALGILDAERRYNMSVDDAIALGIKAIRYSTLRDAYSGGFINVYLITPRDGWQRVFTEDPDQMMASMAEQSVEESA
jgi:20S proteasome subunit beta 5